MFRPFGVYLGLRARKHVRAPTNDVLEEYYSGHKGGAVHSHAKIQSLARELGKTERQASY